MSLQPEMRSYAEKGFLPPFAEFVKGAENPQEALVAWNTLAAMILTVSESRRGHMHSAADPDAPSSNRIEIAVHTAVEWYYETDSGERV